MPAGYSSFGAPAALKEGGAPAKSSNLKAGGNSCKTAVLFPRNPMYGRIPSWNEGTPWRLAGHVQLRAESPAMCSYISLLSKVPRGPQS